MSAVLELMNYAAPYEGNFLASIRTLAETLRAQGTQTVLVFPQTAQSRAWASALRQTYPIYFLPSDPVKAALLLRRIIRQYGVTCVHTHFVDHRFYLPLRVAGFGRHIPHVFHAHSLPRFSDAGIRLRRALLHASCVLCVSEAVRDAYVRRGFSGCVCVPNGVATQRLDEAQPFSCRKPFVLTFGYDFAIKGVDVALDAFDRYDPQHRFTLGICPAGRFETARSAILRRYGEMPAWIELLPPRTDVGTYYRAANVFLSASRTEGMPYAVLEAAYCARPLALSDIAPHRQIGLPCAEYFPPEDPHALFLAVQQASQRPQTPENRAYVAQRYSMQTWTQAVLPHLLIKKEPTK